MIHTRLESDRIEGMVPGQHIVVLSSNPTMALEGRRYGLEVRDTLMALSGEGVSFAFLFRKSIEGTVAENVLRYGVGGLWIEGCRIGFTKRTPYEDPASVNGGAFGKNGVYGEAKGQRPTDSGMDSSKGRWPTNLVFIHGPECRPMGVKRVKSGPSTYLASTRTGGFSGIIGTPLGQPSVHYGDADGMETVTAWDCQNGCPVAALDRQSGQLTSGAVAAHHMRNSTVQPSRGGYEGGLGARDYPLSGYGDSGGASRFFPQFADRAELLGWLAKLIGESG